jgi:hypothetical protein
MDDGWGQVRAGLALIQSSRLASWDEHRFKLVPADALNFEAATKQIHNEYGRVISWITFSVGIEYLLKGICLLRGLIEGTKKPVLRPPLPHEDAQSWVRLVCDNQEAAKETAISFGTLGNVPLRKLVRDLPERDLAWAALELLRQSIRNRDAHQYARGVRAAHFRAVPDLFVPALNALLDKLPKGDLRTRCTGLAGHGTPNHRIPGEQFAL